MRSSVNSLLLFLSTTSLVAACGDDGNDCGTGGASSTISATVGDSTITYDTLTGLAGNDCPDPNAPAGVVSYTIEGFVATGREDGLITFCIPRPDLLNAERTLGHTSAAQVHLVDLTAKITNAQGTCTYHLDPAVDPSGTATGAGVCDNAENAAGFSLDVTASGMLAPIAGSPCTGSIPFSISGTVAVTQR